MDDDSLHSLLAGGRLSGAQRERVLAAALRQSRRRTWIALGAAGTILPAAAALAFLFLRTAPQGTEANANQSHLVPKGNATPVLSARCPDRASGTCRQGDRLIFELAGATAPGFFAAYAECGSRERIWYFPKADGELPRVAGGSKASVVNQAARIGPEHGQGRCGVHLFLLPERASRASVLALSRERPDGGTEVNVAIDVEP